MKEQLQKFAKDFFTLSEFSTNSIHIQEEETNIFVIQLQTDDSALLIWKNGKNLDDIQHIIRLLVRQKVHPDIKVSLEINDYRQSKDEHLKQFILSKVALVEKQGRDIKLPFYNAYQRKKIHGFVSEYANQDIFTKSIGEWSNRRLYICKKDPKLSIDMDGLGI